MADQLVFDLPARVAMGRDDFMVSSANAAAVAGIEGWRDWPHGKAILVGPEGSGKTHLAHVFADQAGARVITAEDLVAQGAEPVSQAPMPLVVEDVDSVAGDTTAETTLFHVHNALAGEAQPLLLTARTAPSRWGLGLPDLASRMAQAGVYQLQPPDDALLMALMVKLSQDRQLPLTPELIAYALPRIERSFAAVQSFIKALDARSLAEKKPPKKKHIKALLEAAANRAEH